MVPGAGAYDTSGGATSYSPVDTTGGVSYALSSRWSTFSYSDVPASTDDARSSVPDERPDAPPFASADLRARDRPRHTYVARKTSKVNIRQPPAPPAAAAITDVVAGGVTAAESDVLEEMAMSAVELRVVPTTVVFVGCVDGAVPDVVPTVEDAVEVATGSDVPGVDDAAVVTSSVDEGATAAVVVDIGCVDEGVGGGIGVGTDGEVVGGGVGDEVAEAGFGVGIRSGR